MAHRPNNSTPPEYFSAFAGLPAALVFALLLIGAFGVQAFQTTMPPSERWAALTAFVLLALAYVLQGSAGLYDALGRVVRRDTRALVVLVALVPVLYVSYSISVDEFSWIGLATALVFVSLPTVAMLRNKRVRSPTLLDFVVTGYLWLSIDLGLVPSLQLPQQGGQVGFFALSAIPLLLLLLAARGWPGLGFTWFLSWSDLRITLLAAVGLLIIITPLALAIGSGHPAFQELRATALLSQAIRIYFFVALPSEIFFRGVFQNGIERSLIALQRSREHSPQTNRLRDLLLRSPRMLSLILAALLFSFSFFYETSMDGRAMLLAFLAGLGYGYVYQRTGKVTASAVVHLLLLWGWGIFLR